MLHISRIVSITFLVLSAGVHCFGQSEKTLPEFAVASIHRVDPKAGFPGIQKGGGPGTRTPTVFRCQFCTISMLVGIAFDLNPYQIVVPAAADDEHYIIEARLPPGSSKQAFQGMVRRVLIERFGLVYRRQQKR
ncbi:MAG: hypothetical protein JWN34_4299 [Bryobacterales bacterium]|nr:hypothetical protein [Bryobacterales bacterium]